MRVLVSLATNSLDYCTTNGMLEWTDEVDGHEKTALNIFSDGVVLLELPDLIYLILYAGRIPKTQKGIAGRCKKGRQLEFSDKIIIL